MSPGVFVATKKSGEVYYRANITAKGKHVSLGSFPVEEEAAAAYREAKELYENESITLLNYHMHVTHLNEDKVITILNHRDNGMYIKTPIYLRSGYFSYFLKGIGELKFDNDDLFYYSVHRILVHDGHMYVNDFGLQEGILKRFGIKNFAVPGKDYTFANGDETDFRYQNVIVINKYHGVTKEVLKGQPIYVVKIQINGAYTIGRFKKETDAAVAYNKAADAALSAGVQKNFIFNYVVELNADEYHEAYQKIKMPKKYMDYLSAFS